MGSTLSSPSAWLCSPFPFSSESHLPSIDSNSKQPPPSPNLPGCLTLCYVPERSEIMREGPLAPGPSPANLMQSYQTFYPSTLSQTDAPSLGFGSQALKSLVTAYFNRPGVTWSPLSTSLASPHLHSALSLVLAPAESYLSEALLRVYSVSSSLQPAQQPGLGPT